jgi:hypothetical protein
MLANAARNFDVAASTAGNMLAVTCEPPEKGPSGVAMRPAQALRADAIAFEKAVAAPGSAGLLIVIGKIAHAQFERIDPESLGRFVHRRLKCKRARRRPRSPHMPGFDLW